jgi:hypothetical protein
MEYRQPITDGVDVVAVLEADVKGDVEVRRLVGGLDQTMCPEIVSNRLPNIIGPDRVVGQRVARDTRLILDSNVLRVCSGKDFLFSFRPYSLHQTALRAA